MSAWGTKRLTFTARIFFLAIYMISCETLSISPVSLASCDLLVSGELVVSAIPLSLNLRVERSVPLAHEVARLIGSILAKAERPDVSSDDFLDQVRREIISVHMRLAQGDWSASDDRKFLIDRIRRRFPEISGVSWSEISDPSVFTQDVGNLSRLRSSRGISDSLPRISDLIGNFLSADVLVSAAPVLAAVGRDFWAREILELASGLVREGKFRVSSEILEISRSTYNFAWDEKFPISPASSPAPSPRTVEKIIADLRHERLKARAQARLAAPSLAPNLAENNRSSSNVSSKYLSIPSSSASSSRPASAEKSKDDRLRELEKWEKEVLRDLSELEK
jgi:hypothetical protein